MLIADTSALISIAVIDLLDTTVEEFDVHTTDTVVNELEETTSYDDRHGEAATTVLDNSDRITTHFLDDEFTSSRVDEGEGSCAILSKEIDATFLITDDLRALPELQTVADARVVISPIVLKALVKRAELDREAALEKLDALANQRDWLGAPIYRRAKRLSDK